MKPRILDRSAIVPVRNSFGEFNLIAYQIAQGTQTDTHLALLMGEVGPAMPVRVNSACLTSEVFHDDRCDCAWQLDETLRRFARYGRGIVTYHPGHEGRGVGIIEKLNSYSLMDQGLTTYDAFVALGEPPDARDYSAAVAILRDLGVESVRLVSNSPAKSSALTSGGIKVDAMEGVVGGHNPRWHSYLRSKADSFGHRIVIAPDAGSQRDDNDLLLTNVGPNGSIDAKQRDVSASRQDGS